MVVPDHVVESLGSKRAQVRGTIGGVTFRGTVSRGEGVYRIPVPRELQVKAKVARGDRVQVNMEIDAKPRPLYIPPELRKVLATDPQLARHFEELPPSHRRAWAAHVGDAKNPETRIRRATKAVDGIRNKTFPGG